MTLDAETVEKFTPIFKEAGLSQEMAQKLVDAYAPIAQKLVESNRKPPLKTMKICLRAGKRINKAVWG